MKRHAQCPCEPHIPISVACLAKATPFNFVFECAFVDTIIISVYEEATRLCSVFCGLTNGGVPALAL